MRIYQIKNQTPSQMMGYVIVTGNGKVIVIDGGTQGDADALRKIVNEHGGHIDLWFLTHPHIDHHGAFLIISQNPENITVGCVMRSYLPDEFSDYDTNFCNDIKSINAEFKVTPFKTAELTVGDIYNIDNIKIEVLGISNPEITVNAFNNSVLRSENYRAVCVGRKFYDHDSRRSRRRSRRQAA